MTRPLPPEFLALPLAHRGLHGPGRPENSLPAFEAALAAGYGIELDVQMSADGHAVVFHDGTLDRMTAETGPVAERSLETLRTIPLVGAETTIPSLAEVVALVADRAPLLIEIKDQTRVLGPTDGRLEAAVARDLLAAKTRLAAVMSFNPHTVTTFGGLAPDVPRGLTTSDFDPQDWPGIPPDRRAELATLDAVAATGASFISHDSVDLESPRVAAIKARGLPVLCWTIRSRIAAERALRVADNITFEGFVPGRADA